MSFFLIGSERFGDHQTPPGHPESPARAAVLDRVAIEWRAAGHEVTPPRPVTREALALVHADSYLQLIESLAGRAAAIDPDTFTSPETVSTAALAAGAAVDAVERVLEQPGSRAFVLARPPGHHAERARGMGFCVYNSIAVAAAVARQRGARRVAIVDYDVHHGNGTEDIFLADPDVLYVSTHQYPFYPGTGAATDRGVGAGEGFTVNVPLEMGATSDDYRAVFERVVIPVLQRFRPDLLLVSAGFDAHERDPLGSMRLPTEAFAAMTADLSRLADECCDGRLVAVLEGGYDLQALADCTAAVAHVLADNAVVSWPAAGVRSRRGLDSVALVRAVHADQWKLPG